MRYIKIEHLETPDPLFTIKNLTITMENFIRDRGNKENLIIFYSKSCELYFLDKYFYATYFDDDQYGHYTFEIEDYKNLTIKEIKQLLTDHVLELLLDTRRFNAQHLASYLEKEFFIDIAKVIQKAEEKNYINEQMKKVNKI